MSFLEKSIDELKNKIKKIEPEVRKAEKIIEDYRQMQDFLAKLQEQARGPERGGPDGR